MKTYARMLGFVALFAVSAAQAQTAPDALVKRLFDCLDANKMNDGVHIRLMVTRGVKAS